MYQYVKIRYDLIYVFNIGSHHQNFENEETNIKLESSDRVG